MLVRLINEIPIIRKYFPFLLVHWVLISFSIYYCYSIFKTQRFMFISLNKAFIVWGNSLRHDEDQTHEPFILQETIQAKQSNF